MEITLSTNGTSESLSVLKYENRWTAEDYIRELVADCYIVKEYFDIANNEIKLRGMINLRKLLQLELSNTRNKLHKRNFMPMMRDLEMLNMKYIEDICDLYHIEYTKCQEYMSYSLLRYNTIDEVSYYNYDIINSYIIKLGIEISYFKNKQKRLENEWDISS
jgi:hypothetical protein